MSLAQKLTAHALTLTTVPVPKARRPKFELFLRIFDLNNVPLVTGSCFVKWHLPSSTAAEHRGRTAKCLIKDHKVVFDYDKQLPVRLIVGKDQMLQETWIHLEVLQEYSSSGKGERINLGHIKLNLAEYVEPSEHNHGKEEQGVVRRYLMQDSKINSTLKIGIDMRHVEGDRNYYAPPLRTAPVFGGIAGIMSQEVPEGLEDSIGHMPSLSSKSRETGEMQDMYRKMLAASWVAQPGELKADECIEDIFSGGDGWGSRSHKKGDPSGTSRGLNPDGATIMAEDGSRHTSAEHLSAHGHTGQQSPRSKSPPRRSPGHHHMRSKDKIGDKKAGFGDWPTSNHERGHGKHGGSFGGRASLHHQARRIQLEKSWKSKNKTTHEVDEFDNPYRDDLRSWKVNVDALA